MNSDLESDLIIGVPAIADWMRVPKRKLFYLAQAKKLPFFKIGEQWACRKSTMIKYVAELEHAALVSAGKEAAA